MVKKKIIIIGNWKMYKTGTDAKHYLHQLKPLVKKSSHHIGLAVPFTAIESASKEAKGSNITIGAQTMNNADEGAFTGEIAASMVKDAGATFVLLGHSERRTLFHETDEMINQKVLKALGKGLVPVLCVGESEEERERGHEVVIERQVREGISEVDEEMAEQLIIAYEPVWAIGTGKTATPQIAQKTHHHIRQILEECFGKMLAKKIPILYGGSVKPDNIVKLIKEKDIDGALVGGASLVPSSFAAIMNCK